VTYAPGPASASGRDVAPEFNRYLPVFRRPKGNVRSTSRATAVSVAHNLAKTRVEALGREALEEMLAASRSKFVAIAYSILRNKEDAEDAVQNAFLSGYRHLRSFEGRSALRTWFTRIVFNAALMIQRKRKSSTIKPLPESSNPHKGDWIESIPASQPDPEMVYAESETFQWIEARLGTMSPILRQALTMTYFDELSNEEAGVLLGVTTGTFKARLLRAKRHLANQARRSAFAPIRKPAHSQFSLGNNNHQETRRRGY
jgi:RNA polymerase sigma factor (sigma-70 family)